jgi:hypothetical protein
MRYVVDGGDVVCWPARIGEITNAKSAIELQGFRTPELAKYDRSDSIGDAINDCDF